MFEFPSNFTRGLILLAARFLYWIQPNTSLLASLHFHNTTNLDMQKSADIRPRLFESDLTQVEYSLSFNGRVKKTRIEITAYGDPLVKAMDCVSLLTNHEYGPAGDHFRKIVDRHQDL